jgi:hypothetical protein
MMKPKQRLTTAGMSFGFFLVLAVASPLSGQQPAASTDSPVVQTPSDPLASLNSENRALFDALRKSAQQNDDAATLTSGKQLLPALKSGTKLCDFVTQLTAGAAVETGDIAYALTLLKPLTDSHPDDWHAASLLARAYAERGDKSLRDLQVAHMIDLHKKTSDPAFSKLHVFPIQKVALHSGYAVFLYPFDPLGRENTYLIALIYTNAGKEDYRIELESADVDQAFFKAKHPGERRFSIDSYRESDVNGKFAESQALHGFVDGVFNYDTMRDRMVETANDGKSSAK